MMIFKEFLDFILGRRQFPKYLYKYTTIDTLKICLKSPSVYFSPAEQFNDPFELKYKLNNEYNKKDWIAYLKEIGQHHIAEEVLADFYMQNIDGIHKIIVDNIAIDMKNMGILCLTPHNDNLLMWAHYADSHKGVCIEYDIFADKVFFVPQKVEYSNRYICLNYIKKHKDLIKCIFHKSKVWSYEEEYRIFNTEHVGEPVEINPKAIKSICFGCNCLSKDIDEIKGMIKGKGWTHIQLKKAKIDDSAFKLHFQDLPFE